MRYKIKITAMFMTVLLIVSVFMSFAFANDLKMGDANLDGKITSADARIALRIAAKFPEEYKDDVYIVCDVNNDSKVTSVDARMILQVCCKIYDKSIFFDKFSEDIIISRTKEPSSTRQIDWDTIEGPTTTAVRRPATTTEKSLHPNNYVTGTPTQRPDISTTMAPITLPPVSEPAGEVTTTLIYELTTVPQTTVTIPDTTAVSAPKLEMICYDIGNGVVIVRFGVRNAKSVKSGSLSLTFDSSVLAYESFTVNSDVNGACNVRLSGTDDELGCEFILNQATDGDILFGTALFRVRKTEYVNTMLTLAVRGHNRYNWTDGGGKPISVQPTDGIYYLSVNA